MVSPVPEEGGAAMTSREWAETVLRDWGQTFWDRQSEPALFGRLVAALDAHAAEAVEAAFMERPRISDEHCDHRPDGFCRSCVNAAMSAVRVLGKEVGRSEERERVSRIAKNLGNIAAAIHRGEAADA